MYRLLNFLSCTSVFEFAEKEIQLEQEGEQNRYTHASIEKWQQLVIKKLEAYLELPDGFAQDWHNTSSLEKH